MSEKLADQEVLLVKEKDNSKLKAVVGTDETGILKTVSPKQANESQFLKIDKHRNPLENFFSNFQRQYKNPSDFQFFKIPAKMVEKTVTVLDKMLKNPETPSNKKMLEKYQVKPEQFSKNEDKKQEKSNLIDESKIDWKQLEQLGVSKDYLKNTKNLDAMLNYQKTPGLIPITLKTDDITIRTDARLAFRKDAEGNFKVAVHAVRNKPELDKPYFGVTLTDEDKNNLLKTGNAGRILLPQYKSGEATPVFLSIDKLTNELVAARGDKIKIPETIKGVLLDENQKKELAEGKAIYVEGMTAKSGKEFNATLQINADKRGVEFRFDQAQNQTQKSGQQNGKVRIPKSLLGAELSEEQQKKLEGRETIYVKGMKDKKGQEFNAYIKINDEKGKLDFYKWNPNKAKSNAEVTPDKNSEIQVAVNSEGKTNEATNKVKEPLKKGQTQPTEKQQENTPKQSRGRKM